MFIICNNLGNIKNEIENFIINLNRPFIQGINPYMQNNIIEKLYMESDANETSFINRLSDYNLILKNFKSLPDSTIFIIHNAVPDLPTRYLRLSRLPFGLYYI